MHVCIKGNHFTKTEKNRLADLAKWLGPKLMGGRLSRHINLQIQTVHPNLYKRSMLYAYVDYDDISYKTFPRKFTITMTGHFRIMRSMVILAHELVHVKQYATGELSYCDKTGREKWKGRVLKDKNLSYWDLPHEIEAHGREKGLVYQYCEVKNLCQEKWFTGVF